MSKHTLIESPATAFGESVAARLRSDGATIIRRLADLPSGAVLHVLVVNLVAATADIRFRAVTDDDLRTLLDRQLYPFVTAVQAATPRMSPGSAIVVIVPNAHLGSWGGVHVAATAAACIAMARSMALELAPHGIRVNCVATDRSGDVWDTPAGRVDIAATVAWLAGSDSGQLNGETILADRGASLRMTQARRR